MSEKTIWEKLSEPFPKEHVEFRIGNTNKQKGSDAPATMGQVLAYIDARTVMERLDDVLGPGNWQCRYVPCGEKKIACEVGVWEDGSTGKGEWVWKSDGAGETDIEGEKGAFSDSFKRAAVRFGVGRYLYSLGSPWVPLRNGRYPAISDAEIWRRIEAGEKGSPTSHEGAQAPPSTQAAPSTPAAAPSRPAASGGSGRGGYDRTPFHELPRWQQDFFMEVGKEKKRLGEDRVREELRRMNYPNAPAVPQDQTINVLKALMAVPTPTKDEEPF